MVQYARPDSDISAAAWTPTPLWSNVDEGSPGDATEITVSGLEGSTSALDEVSLSDVTDPNKSTEHVIRFKGRFTEATESEVVDIEVQLFQGATFIATTGFRAMGSSAAEYTYTLSAAEADAITDYSDLRLKCRARGIQGAPS